MGDHPPLQALRNTQLQPCGGGRQSHEAHVHRHEALCEPPFPLERIEEMTTLMAGDGRMVVPPKANHPLGWFCFCCYLIMAQIDSEHVPIPQGGAACRGGLLRGQLQISEGVLLSMAGICISGTSRQSPCVFADHRSGVKHDQQLRDWHRKPDRIGVDQRRKNHDQMPLMTESPCHKNERCLQLHDRLEIIGRRC